MSPLRIVLAMLFVSAVVSPTVDAATSSAFKRLLDGSPVQWHSWEPATLSQARESGRPVYVFIGAFLSELSRATCRQTFSNADTAAFLNANFVCIAVDRDEQPEVAALAQHYLRTIAQTDGWPAHLWFTPELQPYEGAGYLPPTEEWGKPGFLKVAQKAAEGWKTNPTACRNRGDQAVSSLAKAFDPLPAGATSSQPDAVKNRLAAAAEAWRARFDATNGGFGDTPKSPEPELLRFLLRQSEPDRQAALATLRALAASPMRDPLDGGFFRSASDAAWRMPYPQKAAADQARLALAFLDGAQAAGDAAFVSAARGALDYVLARLARPDGTFAAGEDATGDQNAIYYAWTEAEIDAVLGKDAAEFKSAHGVAPAGNVPESDDITGHLKGRNLLRPASAPDASDARLAARLLAARDARAPISRDDRATAGTHGLVLAALSRAAAQLEEARYAAAAERLFATIRTEFVTSPAGAVRRVGGAESPAAPTDYAALALGCREYSRLRHDTKAAALADRLLAHARELFFDSAAGRFYAVPAELPPGFAVRPPALAETPAAEPLALLTGIFTPDARVLAAALLAQPDAVDAPPSGDLLLALSTTP